MNTARLRTVRDLMRFAVNRFDQAELSFGHGTHNAHDEAAYLVSHALELPLDQLDRFLDTSLTGKQVKSVLKILRQRVAKKIPAPYLTHEAWLGDLRFYVDRRVIVPRSFIAELLRTRLQPWIKSAHAINSALDLCTGSGCLAILMALVFPNAVVDASDVSRSALAVARRNISDYGFADRINLIRSSLFNALHGRRYDLIVANPPYVNARTMRTLPAEYRYEPRLALDGGKDGLDYVRPILKSAAKHLRKKGLLVVEIGHNRAILERAFPKIAFTWPETSAGNRNVFLLDRGHLS
ncbi:MAG TPA: 50S ribosomal protein L3 N(5)-glutamine methyltransferase [Burkholderiales bacterium]|nr:50S ribosomal protein L3 N(5)-glutamine methyltransferase [Burkholderiales bacterium]